VVPRILFSWFPLLSHIGNILLETHKKVKKELKILRIMLKHIINQVNICREVNKINTFHNFIALCFTVLWRRRIGPQNCTSKFHILSYCVPIHKWDTSMNLWRNYQIIYVKKYLLGDGLNFSPFSCSIFP